MKLFIKQNLMSAFDHFYVKDEQGFDVYEVRGNTGIRVGLKLRIYDLMNHELCYIEQKNLSLLPTFKVFKDGVQVATIVKKFTLVKPKYVVEELGWEIEGDFLAHEYVIKDSVEKIATISKDWTLWVDSFLLDMQREEHVLEALACILAIDYVVDEESDDIKISNK